MALLLLQTTIVFATVEKTITLVPSAHSPNAKVILRKRPQLSAFFGSGVPFEYRRKNPTEIHRCYHTMSTCISSTLLCFFMQIIDRRIHHSAMPFEDNRSVVFATCLPDFSSALPHRIGDARRRSQKCRRDMEYYGCFFRFGFGVWETEPFILFAFHKMSEKTPPPPETMHERKGMITQQLPAPVGIPSTIAMAGTQRALFVDSIAIIRE